MTNPAQDQLLAIKDTRIKEQILKRIKRLKDDPGQQGKSLDKELYDYRSVRAVGQRYRIIYKIYKNEVLVLVVMLGIRKEGDKKDVYALAKNLEKLGLLDLFAFPPEVDNKPEATEE